MRRRGCDGHAHLNVPGQDSEQVHDAEEGHDIAPTGIDVQPVLLDREDPHNILHSEGDHGDRLKHVESLRHVETDRQHGLQEHCGNVAKINARLMPYPNLLVGERGSLRFRGFSCLSPR